MLKASLVKRISSYCADKSKVQTTPFTSAITTEKENTQYLADVISWIIINKAADGEKGVAIDLDSYHFIFNTEALVGHLKKLGYKVESETKNIYKTLDISWE